MQSDSQEYSYPRFSLRLSNQTQEVEPFTFFATVLAYGRTHEIESFKAALRQSVFSKRMPSFAILDNWGTAKTITIATHDPRAELS